MLRWLIKSDGTRVLQERVERWTTFGGFYHPGTWQDVPEVREETPEKIGPSWTEGWTEEMKQKALDHVNEHWRLIEEEKPSQPAPEAGKAELIMPGGVSFGSYKPASAGANSDSEAREGVRRVLTKEELEEIGKRANDGCDEYVAKHARTDIPRLLEHIRELELSGPASEVVTPHDNMR